MNSDNIWKHTDGLERVEAALAQNGVIAEVKEHLPRKLLRKEALDLESARNQG